LGLTKKFINYVRDFVGSFLDLVNYFQNLKIWPILFRLIFSFELLQLILMVRRTFFSDTPQKKAKLSLKNSKTFPRRRHYKSYVRFGNDEEMYLVDKKFVGLTVLGKGAYGTVV
jgi:hypothetical protein